VRPPAAPHALDEGALHVTADSEVDVQTVAARVPLGHPQVRQRLAAELRAQLAEERGNVGAELAVVEAARPGVGQSRAG
jgi:hypothetical protein